MTPLVFVSFVLSLFLVERRDRSWRVSQHTASSESLWSKLSLWNWLDPEPYQNPDSTWRHSKPASDAQDPGFDTASPGRPQWFTRKKHRKMAKMHLGDALEMRATVMWSLIGVVAVGILAIVWAIKRAFG
jgi:hypothetical protein